MLNKGIEDTKRTEIGLVETGTPASAMAITPEGIARRGGAAGEGVNRPEATPWKPSKGHTATVTGKMNRAPRSYRTSSNLIYM